MYRIKNNFTQPSFAVSHVSGNYFFPAYQTCVCVWHADTGNGARCKMKASLMSHRNIQDEDVGLSITGFSVCVYVCVYSKYGKTYFDK